MSKIPLDIKVKFFLFLIETLTFTLKFHHTWSFSQSLRNMLMGSLPISSKTRVTVSILLKWLTLDWASWCICIILKVLEPIQHQLTSHLSMITFREWHQPLSWLRYNLSLELSSVAWASWYQLSDGKGEGNYYTPLKQYLIRKQPFSYL